jgi:hypothetical protein
MLHRWEFVAEALRRTCLDRAEADAMACSLYAICHYLNMTDIDLYAVDGRGMVSPLVTVAEGCDGFRPFLQWAYPVYHRGVCEQPAPIVAGP